MMTETSAPAFDPVLCQTCGMPYGIAGDAACEEHQEALGEGYQQHISRSEQRAHMEGALSILVAMRGWCLYDVAPDFDYVVQQQIRDYEKALADSFQATVSGRD